MSVRRHADLRRVVVHALSDPLDSPRDVVVTKGRLRGLYRPLIHQIAPQAETPVLQQQRLVLVRDQQQPVGASQVEKAFAVPVLAQHAGGVEVAPLGQVLVDPVALCLDDVLDPLVGDRLGRADEHAAVALDDDVRRCASAADDLVGDVVVLRRPSFDQLLVSLLGELHDLDRDPFVLVA